MNKTLPSVRPESDYCNEMPHFGNVPAGSDGTQQLSFESLPSSHYFLFPSIPYMLPSVLPHKYQYGQSAAATLSERNVAMYAAYNGTFACPDNSRSYTGSSTQEAENPPDNLHLSKLASDGSAGLPTAALISQALPYQTPSARLKTTPHDVPAKFLPVSAQLRLRSFPRASRYDEGFETGASVITHSGC